MSDPTDICNWNQEDDEYSTYETDCGQAFVLNRDEILLLLRATSRKSGKTLVGHPFVEECAHENMGVIEDAEGDLDESRLTRYFTTYDCPDCGYNAESPPPGWLPPFDEPTDDD